MIRVGVVGVGAMGQHHARIYSQLGCLVGVSDADEARAKGIGEKYAVPYYTNYHELLDKVDAVSIVVPTTLHRQVAADFLKRGVHCLVEKPIASTLSEAEDMIRLARENHAKLMTGHIERFNPAVTALKKVIDAGTLGQLLIISTRRVGPSVPRIRDVGVIIDSATHDIDVARYLVGHEPISVYSKFGSLKHPKEDHAVIVLDFKDTTACVEVNWFTPHKVRTLVATGSEGIAYLDYIEQQLTVRNSHDTEVIQVEKAEPLLLELKHFLKCIDEDKQPLVDGYEGMKTLEIALKASSKVSFPSIVSPS
jgi:UDP-N-acetylglucosamine 3-dehydrogenase